MSAQLCFEKLDPSWIWFQYVSLHTAVISSEDPIQVQSESVRNSVSQNSRMLPPSKRFKMENSIPVVQNGIETARTGTADCHVSAARLLYVVHVWN